MKLIEMIWHKYTDDSDTHLTPESFSKALKEYSEIRKCVNCEHVRNADKFHITYCDVGYSTSIIDYCSNNKFELKKDFKWKE